MSKSSFYDNAPSLFIQSGVDKSQLFGLNSARDVRHFVLRGTGGCGLMSPQDAVGLRNLELALTGRTAEGQTDPSLPRFSGLCLFGGTRMVRKDNPEIIIPGITEVFPSIEKYCDKAAMLGVIAKVGHLRYTQHGIIISDEADSEFCTIIHPTQTSCVLLQPSADMQASWDDEFKECVRIVHSLIPLSWKGLLLAYNGGGVTEKEIRTWAKHGQRNPAWNVLLVKGSGRKCDELANDDKFLADHPTVHVCENDIDHMREKLVELEALVEVQPEPESK